MTRWTRTVTDNFKSVVPNRGAIYNTQGCHELIHFLICRYKYVFKQPSHLKSDCYGFATGWRILYFFSVGCRNPEKIGNHCFEWMQTCLVSLQWVKLKRKVALFESKPALAQTVMATGQCCSSRLSKGWVSHCRVDHRSAGWARGSPETPKNHIWYSGIACIAANQIKNIGFQRD